MDIELRNTLTHGFLVNTGTVYNYKQKLLCLSHPLVLLLVRLLLAAILRVTQQFSSDSCLSSALSSVMLGVELEGYSDQIVSRRFLLDIFAISSVAQTS